MRVLSQEELIENFDEEFEREWTVHRTTFYPFRPREKFEERVSVVELKSNTAIIKRMDEDGEIYNAEVPINDLRDFKEITR